MGMWDSNMGYGDSFKGMGSAGSMGMGDEDIFGMLKSFMGGGQMGDQQMNLTGFPGSNPSGGSGNPSAWARGGTAPRQPLTALRGASPSGGGGVLQLIKILQMLLGQGR